MRLRLNTTTLRAIALPGWERGYFMLAALAALFFVVATPLETPEFAVEKQAAIERHTGAFDAGGIERLLTTALSQPDVNDSADLNALRQMLDERLRMVDPATIGGGRNLFMGTSEESFPMPPIELDFPTLPQVPVFDLPTGDVPAPNLQNRPIPPDRRPVSLEGGDKRNPYDFDDRNGTRDEGSGR